MRPPPWLARHIAALRMLLVLSVLTGLAYPLAVLGAAQLPGLRGPAAGSLVTGPDGEPVGSALLGQPFVDRSGAAIERYFLPRPSAAGPPPGYHATDSGGSNLGPEDVVDRPGRPSLLTQVCRRSLQVGQREGVDGSRPYCTPDGVGAVLAVFRDGGAAGPVTRAVSLNLPCPATPFPREYRGVAVECARPGVDYTAGAITPVRGTAPPVPAASRRTSAPPTPGCRHPEWQGSGASTCLRSWNWSTSTPPAGYWASSGSRRSTCSSSTSPSIDGIRPAERRSEREVGQP
jgi:K+-transporting ATPase ATPase C chain